MVTLKQQYKSVGKVHSSTVRIERAADYDHDDLDVMVMILTY